jgi:hypothetical protein
VNNNNDHGSERIHEESEENSECTYDKAR